MTITGKIIQIFDTKQVSDRFRKREFVVEYADNPDYPQTILFQMTQDHCDKLDGFSKDQTIKVDFNLRGRSWTNPQGEVKYFNSLEAWRLDLVEGAANPVAESQPVPQAEAVQTSIPVAEQPKGQEFDDMPF